MQGNYNGMKGVVRQKSTGTVIDPVGPAFGSGQVNRSGSIDGL